jgi:RNA polymerase sigma factor (sigma-70 family)
LLPLTSNYADCCIARSHPTADAQQVHWQNRAHFFGIAAQLMRRVLVDFARSRGHKKRGGGAHQVSLDETMVITKERGEDLVALDEALSALSELDESKGRVVEMRFFGGLSEKEIAEALTVSQETVRRDWRLAKSWLRRRLGESTANGQYRHGLRGAGATGRSAPDHQRAGRDVRREPEPGALDSQTVCGLEREGPGFYMAGTRLSSRSDLRLF